MSDNSKFKVFSFYSNKLLKIFLAEITQKNDEQTEQQTTSSSFNNINTSTPVRLFGQFKTNGTGFSNFTQLSSNGDNSSSLIS